MSLLKLTSIKSVMSPKHLIFCHSLLLLPSIFSSIRVFSNSQLLASSGQSIGASASASKLSLAVSLKNVIGLKGRRWQWYLFISICVGKQWATMWTKKPLMQLNHGNLSTYLQEKVLAKQVNFIVRYLHSDCIGSECASVWKSSFAFQPYSLGRD